MQENSGFTPPGPGVWELESTHILRPVSRAMEGVFPDAATAGFREGMARYGLLLDCMEFKTVNRFIYTAARGVGAPPDAKAPPPKLIFKLLTKLHPEIRRRIRTVAETFATKRWRADVARWDSETKPAIARENTALQQVDLRALSNAELVQHLQRCFDAARRSITTHHSLNATAMLPLGDFLVHVREWTGLAPSAVLPLFRGSSRVSQGAAEELDALARAIGANSSILEGEPAVVVDALTTRTDAIGEAARRYLHVAGVRTATGYDVCDLTLSEMPDVIVENIKSALARQASRSQSVDVNAIRDKVPAEHRAQFDELLEEARHTYRMRDERVYYNDAWATGITRRAILEAGRRLAAQGLLHDAQHAVELTLDELTSMLNGGPGRTADQAAADAQYRTSHSYLDAPPFLGGTPSGPPPAEWLPEAAARSQRAVAICLEEMFAARGRQSSGAKISGHAASPGEVTGVARLVLDPQDMGRVRQGDVLIARSTAPSYNALLPLLKGIVTDRGGTLSHAAVVAREYGIPAVVGCGNATELIRDGVRVRLDGARGTVEVLA
ncbi:MAG TPA: PEP-utilizing enzyme [Thermoanaerobaculia bacterium]|nr:PEP-utilizing enzyme [Thermoanaerobaculia bacterium]